ncbi:unnamed protein product, partial [Coccothraustes coccothraustes]
KLRLERVVAGPGPAGRATRRGGSGCSHCREAGRGEAAPPAPRRPAKLPGEAAPPSLSSPERFPDKRCSEGPAS